MTRVHDSLRPAACLTSGSWQGPTADGAFAAAHRLAPRVPSPYAVALLELSDGRRLVEPGRRAEAQTVLSAARQRLAALGARPNLERCDALMHKAGAHRGLADARPTFGLTPTETVVAGLVATGRTNQQVAAELFVSVKAIEFHLTNIFAKLRIRSRRDVSAALEGGPDSVGFDPA